MDDYISRQAAIDSINSAISSNPLASEYDTGISVGLAKAETRIQALPSADVQPVRHGHWMLSENQNQNDVNNGNYLYVCSNCNHGDIHAKTEDVPYCWHCGARMDGEKNG